MLLRIVNLTVSTRTALLNVVLLAGLKLVTMDVVLKTALFGSRRLTNGTVNTARVRMMVWALICPNSVPKMSSRMCKRPLRPMKTLLMIYLRPSAPLVTKDALTVALRSKQLSMAATLIPINSVKKEPILKKFLKWLITKQLASLTWLKMQLLMLFLTTLTYSSPQNLKELLTRSRMMPPLMILS